MKYQAVRRLALSMSVGLFACGCSSQSSEPASQPNQSEAGHSEHEHPSTGPHGGDLVELGNEQYHAEVTHENEVVVYILDGAAKAAAPVDATEIVVNLTHEGAAEQFRLAANRDPQDPEGKASRFTSNDAELLSDLKGGDAEVELVVSIAGKQYRGSLEHEHGDDEHGH